MGATNDLLSPGFINHIFAWDDAPSPNLRRSKSRTADSRARNINCKSYGFTVYPDVRRDVFSRHSLEIHGTALMIKNELTWKLLTTSKFSIDDVIFAHSITLKIIEAWEFRSWPSMDVSFFLTIINFIEWYLDTSEHQVRMRISELRFRTSNQSLDITGYHWISWTSSVSASKHLWCLGKLGFPVFGWSLWWPCTGCRHGGTHFREKIE